jgi:hypothetical protein
MAALPYTALKPFGGPGSSYRFPAPPLYLTLALTLPVQSAGLQSPGDPLTAPSLQMASVGIKMNLTVVDANGNPVNLAGATGLFIRLGYPDGVTTRTLPARLLTNGQDGIVTYTTLPNDITEDGFYGVQVQAQAQSALILTAPGFFWAYQNINGN